MLTIRYQASFRKDYKKLVKRGYDTRLLAEVIGLLAAEKPLPEKHCDHGLRGRYTGFRECHIAPDWLLIYQIDGEELLLYLTRTGSHSDLFR